MSHSESIDEISELITRVSLRDRSAFDSLYRRTSAKLFGVCLRILSSRAEAEEAMQDVFVKIWLKADRFSVSGQSPVSWLVAIARNHAIDRLRARREMAVAPETMVDLRDPAPGPEQRTIATSERHQLDGCLDELEEDRAAAVRGAYLDGESYADLALRHGVPLNTMRTWLRRSLMRLKDCLQR